ncbi:hypothetical protein FHR24_000660 [Wenyingzhuangia heitensis]|uniref:Uncharacterized protein n=1 Tax=Wenyingzhuangia heitensis TaxID=1487859 RepID=A0ABX0UAN8_9FLAO|nr:hypothetical protein [Wenyingzhuangia heitensis]
MKKDTIYLSYENICATIFTIAIVLFIFLIKNEEIYSLRKKDIVNKFDNKSLKKSNKDYNIVFKTK